MNKISDESVTITKQAYGKIYQQYTSSNSVLNDTVKLSLVRFIAYLTGKEVLDVGCAGGRESEYMHEQGLSVSGCDISEEFIHVAQKRCPACTFFVADMRRLEGRANSYNGIWANASFLHVPKSDALATLQGFHEMLRKEGVLYISVMQGEFDGLRENTQMNWPDRQFSDYQPDELKNLLNQANFQILEQSSNDAYWGPTFLHIFCRKR